ncbi:MAG: 30S ribosome-binding factor RbfA [Candidatus Margulisbacteria bacterium]|jgi:ribosome-binding factor A|nr:30S ribosome-binding factor RbfA [Candidatus Margulisiibacteriota bacterium]
MSRAERLAELLKAEIGTIILHKLNDHRIGFVSITAAQASADLSTAKIFISCLGTPEEKKKTLRGLISAIPFIRGILAETIDTRLVPKLRFILDDSLAAGNKRLEILHRLAQEREKREKRLAANI